MNIVWCWSGTMVVLSGGVFSNWLSYGIRWPLVICIRMIRSEYRCPFLAGILWEHLCALGATEIHESH